MRYKLFIHVSILVESWSSSRQFYCNFHFKLTLEDVKDEYRRLILNIMHLS